jgi:hypothetical protein
VRRLDSLAPEVAGRLTAALQAEAIASAVVYRFAEGRTPGAAVALRMVDKRGEQVSWSLVALTADDTEGMFGRGRAQTREELLPRIVERLLRGCPGPGTKPPKDDRRGEPFRQGGPRTYRAASLGSGPHRVVLLPLLDASGHPDAARTATQLLWRRLAASPEFEVVEPAVVRAALAEEKVRTVREIDPAVRLRLAERLGTPLLLTGTVQGWRDESPRGGAVSPRAELDLELTDVRAQRVLWTSHHAREGSDYEFLLRRGAITSAVSLADQMAAEMVRAFEETKATAPRPLKESSP